MSDNARLLLVEGAELYDPEPRGVTSVLLGRGGILALGAVDVAALRRGGIEVETVDARGCLLVPGLIDPHEHISGGSGEEGFSSQTPAIALEEIVRAGVTTVVGCIGADTITKPMASLLARAKALREDGITVYVWSGGYRVPPVSITPSLREDVMFVAEVIGAGEIAISDERCSDPDMHDLAGLVKEVHVAGTLARKAGLTHFHVGEGKRRLERLFQLVDDHEVKPGWLYPTHVQRTPELLEEAIRWVELGGQVDVDTIERDLHEVLKRWREAGADPERLTASSDAAQSKPGVLYESVRACVLEHGFALEQVLPLVTRNTARVLKLANKGRIAVGADADLTILTKRELEVRDVIALGRPILRGGKLVAKEAWLRSSDRTYRIEGDKDAA